MSHLNSWIPRTQKRLLGAVLFLSVINPTTFGYDSLMMSGLNALPQYKDYFHLTEATTGLNTASMWVGQIIAVPFMHPTADYFGRKHAVAYSICVALVGVVLQSAAQNIAMFVIGRMILGLGSAVAGNAAPTLLAEICPTKIRGFVLGLYFSCFNLGAIIASSVTFGTRNLSTTWAWRVPSIVQCVPSFLSLLALLITPESPRWLISRNKIEEATEVFQIVEKIDIEDATAMALEVQHSIEGEKESQSSSAWLEYFRTSVNRRRAFIMITQAWISEMGGSSVGSYYLSTMLMQAGIVSVTSIIQASIVSSVWSMLVAVSACFLFDKLGRKKQSLISLVGMITSFFILGGLVKKYGGKAQTSSSFGVVAMMFVFTGFYQFAWPPMNALYPPEIHDFRLRTTGMSFFKFWDSGFGLMAAFMLPYAINNLGWKFYFVNGGYNVIFLFIIHFVWVETKHVDLEQVDRLFGLEIPEKLCKDES